MASHSQLSPTATPGRRRTVSPHYGNQPVTMAVQGAERSISFDTGARSLGIEPKARSLEVKARQVPA